MISVFNLSDATPIVLFAMLSLWAAASQRHWFVRTMVVGAAILVALLIPAYEVVIEFGLECLFVVIGIAIWKRRRQRIDAAIESKPAPPPFQLRLSMQTMMLAVVIVAVVTAVAARAPTYAPELWYQLVLHSIVAAATCLTCVWIVCGRARWWIRLLAAPFLAAFLALTLHAFGWLGHLINHWARVTPPQLSDYLKLALNDVGGLLYWISTFVLGMTILCTWLYVTRQARWFDPFDDFEKDPPVTRTARRRIALARFGALALFGMAAIFPLVMLYKLMTPTPLPKVELPNPNGFDDYIAAGKMIGPSAAAKLGRWDLLSDAQLRAELSHYAAYDRMRDGFSKKSWNPYVFKPWTLEDQQAINHISTAIRARREFARRTNDLELELEGILDDLRMAQAEIRGSTSDDYFVGSGPAYFEPDLYRNLWNLRERLSAQQCVELAAALTAIGRGRESWETRDERRRIIEENSGWERHIRSILFHWSGRDGELGRRDEHVRRLALQRVLIVELGIRAFELETGRPPATLAELVPKYLSEIPDDPSGAGSIKYRVEADTYTLYCVGLDGEDDGGQPLLDKEGKEVGDLIDAELFPPPGSAPSTTPQQQSGTNPAP
jgi:hypothetical protein